MNSRPPLQENTNVRLVPDTPNTSKEHAPAGDGEPRDGSNMLCEQSGLAVCGELGDMRNVDREKRCEHSSMVTNEAYSLPKENFEEGSSHAPSLVPSTALPRPLLLSSIADSREERSSDRKTARPRKAAQILPLEVWAKILSHLNRNEKVDHTRTCRMFGDIVEDELYREVELDTDTVMSWTAGVTRYTHRAKTMRTLEISLKGASKDSLRDILPHLRKALCALPALQEFSLLDVQGLPEDAAEDILEGVQFSLTQFACDSDALIVKSWASLKKQIYLEEFRGLLDYTRVLQDDMTPDVFPELWLLETSSSFANRITNASTVTNLSIWTAYHQARPTLARVTTALGENLSRLKITRHMMSSPNPYIGYTFAPQNSLPFRAWEAHSPIVLCEAIRAPNLVYFEVDDVCSGTSKEWCRTPVVRDEPWWYTPLNRKLRTECVPRLSVLVWWPAWADSMATVQNTLPNYVIEFFALLPVKEIILPPFVSWDREGDVWGWTSVKRAEGEDRSGTLPQQWYDRTRVCGQWEDIPGRFQSAWDR